MISSNVGNLPNLRIVSLNAHDYATLTTSQSPQPGFPVTNTQNTDRDAVWRGSGIIQQYIRGVFNDNDGFMMNFFGLFRHRCHGGTVRLKLYNQPDWTGLVYDSEEQETVNLTTLGNFSWGTDGLGIVHDPFFDEAPFWHYVYQNSPNTNLSVGAKSYEITFRDTHVQTSADNWEVGRVWLGEYKEVRINPNYGTALTFADNTQRSRTRGGSLRSNEGAYWRGAVIDLAWILEEDRADWVDICRRAKTAKDVVVAILPEDPDQRLDRDHIINGKFVSLDPMGRQVSYLTKRVVIEEN